MTFKLLPSVCRLSGVIDRVEYRELLESTDKMGVLYNRDATIAASSYIKISDSSKTIYLYALQCLKQDYAQTLADYIIDAYKGYQYITIVLFDFDTVALTMVAYEGYTLLTTIRHIDGTHRINTLYFYSRKL